LLSLPLRLPPARSDRDGVAAAAPAEKDAAAAAAEKADAVATRRRHDEIWLVRDADGALAAGAA
jgi:hypothetical protein